MSRGAAITASCTRGTGRKPYPRCPAGGSSDKTVQLWGWAAAGPIDSPSTSHTASVVSVGFSPGRAEPSSQAAGISPCGCGDVASHLARAVLVQPIFELVLRAAHLTQTMQICFQAPRPPQPVRLLVNRSGSRRSSGDTHGPCLRLPLNCQARQTSLTRKRSLVRVGTLVPRGAADVSR
jgi:hypothetical protein